MLARADTPTAKNAPGGSAGPVVGRDFGREDGNDPVLRARTGRDRPGGLVSRLDAISGLTCKNGRPGKIRDRLVRVQWG